MALAYTKGTEPASAIFPSFSSLVGFPSDQGNELHLQVSAKR